MSFKDFIRILIASLIEPITHPQEWARYWADRWGFALSAVMFVMTVIAIAVSARFHYWFWLIWNSAYAVPDFLAAKYAWEDEHVD